jgi:lysophospholipase L1-like esterase
MRFKRIIFPLAGIVLGVAVFLVCAEVSFKLAEALSGNTARAQLLRYNNCFERDPNVFFRLQAGYSGLSLTDEFQYHTHTNALHMRDYADRRHERQIESGHVVLALGDSFTFGTGVEYGDTFLALTERRLRDVVVLNAGVPGYNIYNYLEYLRNYPLNFRPNTVLINIFTGNDLGARMEKRLITKDGYLDSYYRNEISSSLFMRINKFAFNHSAFFRFLRGRGISFTSFRKVFGALGDREVRYENLAASAPPIALLDIEKNRTFPINTVYEHFRAVMGKIKNLTDEGGIRLVVNLLPFRMQVEPEVLTKLANGADTSGYDRRLIHKRTARILDQLGIEYVQPLEEFERQYGDSGARLFWLIDGHFTKEGNALMADVLAGHLGKDGRTSDVRLEGPVTPRFVKTATGDAR